MWVFLWKTFTDELKSRRNNMDSVQKTASDLLKSATKEDEINIKSRIQELTTKWEEVSNLADTKSRRLDEALKQVPYRYLLS